MNWFQAVMRVSSTKLIKMVVGPKAFGEKPFSPDEVKAALEEFFTLIVQELDRWSSRQGYFSGEDLSVVDLMIYNELKTVLVLHKKELSSEAYPDLHNWYLRLSRIQAIGEVDSLFMEIVKTYQLI